ncbi:MAG: hypothetical protein ABTQ32_04440 [Myxococcaceae bacterium]
MNETPPSLTEQLAELAREVSADDVLLERLAAGELSPAERLDLERRAANDPALREAIALHRPLDAARRDAIVDRLVTPAPVRRGALVAAAGLIAIAASVTLFVFTRPAAVTYTLEATGEAAVRGSDTAGAVHLGPGSKLRLLARPASPNPGVAARLFVKSPDLRFVEAPIAVSADGAVRVELAAEQLQLPPGRSLVGLEVGATRLETWVEWAP